MAIKRLISEDKREKLKDLKKYKGMKISQMNQQQKDDLLRIIAEKLNLV